jgi:large subunit ribosomal protein L15
MGKITVGRGGKRGKTSGRGTKGQNARAGHKKYPEIRDLIKRTPKLRGYDFKSRKKAFVPINVAAIDAHFDAGEKVTPASLITKGIISRTKGKNPRVKILAAGEITKKVVISGCDVSEEAKSKIEKAGGTITK